MRKNFILKSEAIFQILILVLAISAFSYLSSESFRLVSAATTNTNSNTGDNSFGTDGAYSCCMKTNAGAYCQNVPKDYSECSSALSPTNCENIAECAPGCCIDEEEGICTVKAPRTKCLQDNGKFDEDPNCNMDSCKRGCCVTGSRVEFVTDKRCTKLSSLLGMEKDFRNIESEIECLSLGDNLELGSCVLKNTASNRANNCKFTSEQECTSLTGDFYKGLLCSNPSLNTTCQKQARIDCFAGRDEIYWFDSCDNRENIYSSDKNISWNEGKILSKGESCNAGSDNIESSSCGNCNYMIGSKCSKSETLGKKVADGNFICKGLNCIEEETGRVRKNGESWCVYDSYIGEGRDPVGSRHWRRICSDGEIKVEPCEDFRGQICVESIVNPNDFVNTETTGETSGDVSLSPDNSTANNNNNNNNNTGNTAGENTRTVSISSATSRSATGAFSVASCKKNEAASCIAYNANLATMKRKCSANPDCFIKTVNVDVGFSFEYCTSNYPKGFELSADSDLGSGNSFCSKASMECVAIEQKTGCGAWKCIYNCKCLEGIFSKQMNELCTSLGDCGSYINYVGKGTDNIHVEKSENAVKWQDYVKYAKAVEGQVARPPELDKILNDLGEATWNVNNYEDNKSNKPPAAAQPPSPANTAAIAGIVGALGGLASYAGNYFEKQATKNAAGALAGLGSSGQSKIVGDAAAKIANSMYQGLPVGTGGSVAAGTSASAIPAAGTGALAGSSGGSSAVSQAAAQMGASAATGASTSQVAAIGSQFGLSTATSQAMAQSAMGSVGTTVAGSGVVSVETVASNAAQAALQTGTTATAPAGGFLSNMLGWMGPILGVLAALMAVMAAAQAIKDAACPPETREVHVQFTCMQWTPPEGGEDCKKCNEDILRPCSKYRCSSLGAACELINEDTENPTCLEKDPRDVSPPMLSTGNIANNFTFKESVKDGARVSSIDGDCVPEYVPVVFNLKTNEYAQCKFDFTITSNSTYEDMKYFTKEQNSYSLNHTFNILIPNIESMEANNIDHFLDKRGNLKIYVKCKDTHGTETLAPYVVNMCVKPGKDVTAPTIGRTLPTNNGFIPYGTESAEFVFYTNEPSECKFDFSPGKRYEEMQKSMNCNTDLTRPTIYGWNCNYVVPIEKKLNKIYVKCKDQPWLNGTDEVKRNINTVDFEYSLIVSELPLNISIISPKGNNLFSNVTPMTLKLELQTFGGAEGGKSTCSYSFGDDNFVTFFNTGTGSHKQTFDSIIAGTYKINLKCVDKGNNIALKDLELYASIDTSAPLITRIYNDKGTLTLFTNEDAKCFYNNQKCNFDVKNSTKAKSMTTLPSKKHTVSYDTGKPYYIKCVDVFGNQPSACTIIARKG